MTRHPHHPTMRAARTDLLQGTLDLIILQMLAGEPTNGWDLTLRIQATSKDVLTVNAGSLYPALYRLQTRGLIKASWKTTVKNRRAKFYALTAKGRRHLASERTTWERFAGALTAILSTHCRGRPGVPHAGLASGEVRSGVRAQERLTAKRLSLRGARGTDQAL